MSYLRFYPELQKPKITFMEFVRHYTTISAMKKGAKSIITSLSLHKERDKGYKFAGGVMNNILWGKGEGNFFFLKYSQTVQGSSHTLTF
jgi:hypothetical protein